MYKTIFLDLSAELTGYSSIELEGTGLADQYYNLITKEIGEDVSEILFKTAQQVLQLNGKARDHAMTVDITASPILWPVCKSIIMLWYLGQWTRMTANWYSFYGGITPPPSSAGLGGTFVPSAQAYTEQLSYKGAGAHPPGAHPTGFASWGLDPLFGDFTNS